METTGGNLQVLRVNKNNLPEAQQLFMLLQEVCKDEVKVALSDSYIGTLDFLSFGKYEGRAGSPIYVCRSKLPE